MTQPRILRRATMCIALCIFALLVLFEDVLREAVANSHQPDAQARAAVAKQPSSLARRAGVVAAPVSLLARRAGVGVPPRPWNHITLTLPGLVLAADGDAAAATMDVRELARAGGVIGFIILALSIAMVALIVEHLITIRRGALMPHGLAEQTHHLILQKQYKQAEEVCRNDGSFLGYTLASGLAEVGLGYAEIEKSMEDASTERAARLFRKIEYLSVIGTIAPMLGLLGTVYGMILAFMEFATKANPQVSELAPGIYKAMVTTLLGLSVAVPAVATFAIFRNRIDQLVAESSLLAEHVFADFKRATMTKRKPKRQQTERIPETIS